MSRLQCPSASYFYHLLEKKNHNKTKKKQLTYRFHKLNYSQFRFKCHFLNFTSTPMLTLIASPKLSKFIRNSHVSQNIEYSERPISIKTRNLISQEFHTVSLKLLILLKWKNQNEIVLISIDICIYFLILLFCFFFLCYIF